MEKDTRFEMRLPAELYVRLKDAAGERESSVAALLREGGEAILGREPEPVKERPAKASVEVARPVGSTPTPSAPSEIKRLAMQKFGHLPLSVGERMARKELGS